MEVLTPPARPHVCSVRGVCILVCSVRTLFAPQTRISAAFLDLVQTVRTPFDMRSWRNIELRNPPRFQNLWGVPWLFAADVHRWWGAVLAPVPNEGRGRRIAAP